MTRVRPACTFETLSWFALVDYPPGEGDAYVIRGVFTRREDDPPRPVSQIVVRYERCVGGTWAFYDHRSEPVEIDWDTAKIRDCTEAEHDLFESAREIGS